MERHFHEELAELKKTLLKMGLLVEESLFKAIQALESLDADIVRQVFDSEDKINALEIEIDQKGLDLMAMEQPLAIDLRRLTMILKINTDLERMGDHTYNIARKTSSIIRKDAQPIDADLIEMANASKTMLKNALDSFVNEDHSLARHVLKSDDEVDNYNRSIGKKLRYMMEEDGRKVRFGINEMMIAYNLERIADLASNIAEDVVFITEGKEIKHHIDE